MASNVASPVVIESVAEVGGHSPDGFGGISGAQEGGLVGEEGESESEEDSGLEEESGSDEEGKPEGEEGEEGGFEEEDYSGDQGWWDDDGTYHGEEEGEYSLAGQSGYGEGDEGRMVWTCGICDITVNIFAHDDHIASRPHIRAAKKQAGETAASLSAELAYVPIWRCTVCSEDMSVFLREEHLFGKEHLRMFRKQQPGEGVHLVAPDDPPAPDQQEDGGHPYVYDEIFPDIPEPCFSSSEYKLRETFYCIICAAEFDLSMEEFHLDDVETWECTLCSKTVHPISKEVHLQSERHTIMASIQEAELEDLHCAICRIFYSPIDEEKHLTGADHLQMVTRVELEQQYMKRMEDLRKKAESSRPPPATALPPTTVKGKGIQTVQNREEEDDPWSCPLCNDALMGLSLEGHLRTFCPANNSKTSVKKRLARARIEAGIAAGADHLQRMENARKKAESSRPPTAATLPPTTDKGKGIQTGQDKKEENDPWSCNLCKEPLCGLSIEGHRRTFCPAIKRSSPSSAEVAPSTQKAPITQNAPYSFYYCDDCKMSVGIAENVSHLVSKEHQRMEAKTAREKKILAKAGSAATGGAARAWSSRKSKAKKKENAQTQFCTVCNTQQKVVGMEDHVNSKKHKRNLAAHRRGAGPSTQVAPPQPTPPMLPQSAPPAPPRPARLALTQAALQLVPSQVAPRGVPQVVPSAIPRWNGSLVLATTRAQILSQMAPHAVPQPVAAPRPALNSPHVMIMGDKFHCKVCGRDRFLVGIEGHLKSKKHKIKVRALGQ